MADGIVFTDGEPLLADSLNTLQQGLYDRIKVHSHTGAGDGPKLGAGSLQDNAVGTAQVHDGAITQSKLDAGLLHTLKDGPSTLGRLFFHPRGGRGGDTLPSVGTPVESASAPHAGAQPAPTTDGGPAPTGGGPAPTDGGPAPTGGVHMAGNTGNLANLGNFSNIGNIGNIGSIGSLGSILIGGGIIGGGIIGNPILLRSEWDVAKGTNISGVYRQQSEVAGAPAVIHIDFVKAYTDANYIVAVTSEWDRATAPQPLLVRTRDPAFVELTVPTGLYQDLAVSFHLTIFGDLA